MLFPLSIIEPCLEKAGVPIEVPPDWALRTFSFASDDTSGVKADDDQQVLLVAPYDCALEIARDSRTRLLLAVSAPDERQQREIAAGVSEATRVSEADTPDASHSPSAPSARDEAQDSAPESKQAAFPVATTTLSPAAVCAAINRYLVSIREWDAEMSRLVLSNCSTQQLIELSEKVLGKYIALSDALYARVATTPHFPPLDDMSRALIETGTYPT